jgi:acylphosphatase
MLVSGDVQGVFFRQATKSRADRSNVRGWIRNRDDGTVEGVFEGEEQDVEALVTFCKRGPPRAMVTNVDIKREAYRGEYMDFTIR